MTLPPKNPDSHGRIGDPANERKRRPFKRLHNTNRARKDDIYSILEIARLYRVEEQTVFNWLKNGLQRVPGATKILVSGSTLNEFHKDKKARSKQPLGPTEFYCFSCKGPREPTPGSVTGASKIVRALRFEAKCSWCGKSVYRAWSQFAANALNANAELICPLFPQLSEPATIPAITEHTPCKTPRVPLQTSNHKAPHVPSDAPITDVKLQPLAMNCDSVIPGKTTQFKKSTRTAEVPDHTNDHGQLPLLFGF